MIRTTRKAVQINAFLVIHVMQEQFLIIEVWENDLNFKTIAKTYI